jgi:hypothetical protein
MNIHINAAEKLPVVKAANMPIGSIGKVNNHLYIIHTNETGDDFIAVWPTSNPPGIEHKIINQIDTWDVELLPRGSTLTLTF